MPDTRYLTIEFNNGDRQIYSFDDQGVEDQNRYRMLKDVLESGYITLREGGGLNIIPLTSVRNVRLDGMEDWKTGIPSTFLPVKQVDL